MLTNIILLIIGFVLLVRGADIFVDGSAGLARNFKIPPLIIGLTIVACGTSAPEFAVSTLSALRGSSEIAISNIVGSNLFNLLGILGLCAMIYPLQVSNSIVKRDFPVSIIGTIITRNGVRLTINSQVKKSISINKFSTAIYNYFSITLYHN